MGCFSPGKGRFLSPCGQVLVGSLSALGAAVAVAVEFDAALLRQGSSADLRRFEQGAQAPQGSFSLDITLNQQWKGRHVVVLKIPPGAVESAACYSETLLHSLGLDVQRFGDSVREALAGRDACVALDRLGVVASETLDLGNQGLDLQIAQDALRRQPNGYLPPDQWDSGVSAGFINYTFSHYQRQDRQQRSNLQQSFLGGRAGVNTGDWYWRHDGSWQASNTRATRYQAGATSVRTDVPTWSAQITLGDGYSNAGVFPGSAFRGVLLGTDERMLAQELRGFAPTVKGVASSTALLTVRQRGVLLHESTVAPGPFEIDDLPASGLSEELEVSLRQADGSVRTFFLPNQVAPLALRPGASRFEFSSGVWRNDSGRTGPGFIQGSWQQGVDNRFSVHGGAWLAEDYLASAMGAAINSGVGAFGLTHYHSRTTLSSGQSGRGHAMRLSWRHRLSRAGTDLGATLTQSNSADHYSFDEFANGSRRGRARPLRRRLQLSVHQHLGDKAGRLSFTTSDRLNWSGGGRRMGYNLGYSNYLGALTYGLNINREQGALGQAFTNYTFNASVPFGERRRSTLSSGVNVDSLGRSTSNLRWSAVDGEQGQWGYGLAVAQQQGVRNDAGLDATLRHSGAGGQISGSLVNRGGYRQAAVGAQGALVAHGGGVIAAPPLGDSFAIVQAPGAAGAGIRQHPQVRLDQRGYAVLPSLAPYQLNSVELDPKGTAQDVELQLTGQSVAPRAGAATLLHYPTRVGSLQVIEARLNDGTALPFGAQVFDEQGLELGLVGQGSQLYVRSAGDQPKWQVVWGDTEGEQCWIASEPRTEQEQSAIICTPSVRGGS